MQNATQPQDSLPRYAVSFEDPSGALVPASRETPLDGAIRTARGLAWLGCSGGARVHVVDWDEFRVVAVFEPDHGCDLPATGADE